MRRIVLTGGPGSGKTAVASALAAQWLGRFALVPEAATQVYARLNTRWDRLDDAGRRDVQRQIYRLQLEQEREADRTHAAEALLLDRGTVDGAAYWPGGPESYWAELGTTYAAELSRYDRVVWLQTCAVVGAYDGDASNACRHENPQDAVRRGEALLEVWRPHPDLRRVDAFPSFGQKLAAVREILQLPNA